MNRRHFLLSASVLGLAALAPSLALSAGALAVLLPPWVTLPKEMTETYKGAGLDIQTLGWDEVRTTIVTSMLANTAPASVTEMDWCWVGQFGSAGWYDPLDAAHLKAAGVGLPKTPAKSQVAADVAAALMPNVNGKSRTFGLPRALGIPANAENKEQAAGFIQWMLEPAAMEANYRLLGNLSTRLSVVQTLNGAGNLKQVDVRIAQAEVVEPLFAQGTPGWYPEFSGAVATALNATAKGPLTVDQAVAQIADAAAVAQE